MCDIMRSLLVCILIQLCLVIVHACSGGPPQTATISLDSADQQSISLRDGQVLECPVGVDGTFKARFGASWSSSEQTYGPPPMTEYSVHFSVCGDLPSSHCQGVYVNRDEDLQREIVITPISGEHYTMTLDASSDYIGRASTGIPNEKNQICRVDQSACRQSLTATCFFNDTAGYAAAIASSPTGGVGTDVVLYDDAYTTTSGTAPPPDSAYATNLGQPLSGNQTLNPRCRLDSLDFVSLFDNSIDPVIIPLPQDGTDTVVVTNCSFTDAQIAMLTTPGDPYRGSNFQLQLKGPLVCVDSVQYYPYGGYTSYFDETVVGYRFSGDLQITDYRDRSNWVCGTRYGSYGPSPCNLPAETWRQSAFQVTVTHGLTGSLCTNGLCMSDPANGGCNACSYTYKVQFACAAPPPASTISSSTGSTDSTGDVSPSTGIDIESTGSTSLSSSSSTGSTSSAGCTDSTGSTSSTSLSSSIGISSSGISSSSTGGAPPSSSSTSSPPSSSTSSPAASSSSSLSGDIPSSSSTSSGSSTTTGGSASGNSGVDGSTGGTSLSTGSSSTTSKSSTSGSRSSTGSSGQTAGADASTGVVLSSSTGVLQRLSSSLPGIVLSSSSSSGGISSTASTVSTGAFSSTGRHSSGASSSPSGSSSSSGVVRESSSSSSSSGEETSAAGTTASGEETEPPNRINSAPTITPLQSSIGMCLAVVLAAAVHHY